MSVDWEKKYIYLPTGINNFLRVGKLLAIGHHVVRVIYRNEKSFLAPMYNNNNNNTLLLYTVV